MSNRSLAFLVGIGALALITNPDEMSFKKHMERELQERGDSWLERKVISTVSALVYERKDFKFFSVVSIPEEEVFYLGLFGSWLMLPTLTKLKEILSRVAD